ncbi:MAG TPA: phosphate ABC transporter permease subunit PstC [Lentisphaeria bacterium]|nr:MAG: phosphate ABC transporter permease subunit PstC [Lentisphaerae bacterium GWF2_50_93]HCE44336.1 phosphate ABC transporter permease subunit PstC [Lentisphaeria bacterium]
MAELRKKSKNSQSLPDRIFKALTFASALIIIVLMAGLFLQLVWHSMPTIRKFGFEFFLSKQWDPVNLQFGALSSIYGTIVTSVIAMIIAVPLSFVIALFLVEIAGPKVRVVVSQALDLLAAIPSIIYGMWGLFIFAPFMQDHIQPFLGKYFSFLPFFKGTPMGIGMFTSGLILALMILPFISAVMRDVFQMVPPVVKESAYGVGSTTWEVSYHVTMKYGMQGMLGAVFLGLGRAIGETMAVTFVIGNAYTVSASLFDPATTIASTLASQFSEAVSQPVFKSTLMELGLVLFIVTFGIQVAAQWWLNKIRRSSGGGL